MSCLCAAFSCGTQEAVPASQTPATLKVRVNLVLLHTRVIDRTGAPVLDLKQDEFQVFEDGNEKPLAFLAASDVPLHVAMVMDVSTSTRELLPQLRKAAQNFAEQFRPEDRLAVYTIAGSVVRQVQFTVNHGHVRQLLGNLETYDPYGFRGAPERREAVKLPVPGNGGTLLYDGLSAIERDFPAAAQRRVVLVFTDAEDSGSAMTFPELHKKMARGSTAVYAVLPELRRADREKLIQEKVGRSLMTAWPKGTHWFLLWEQTPEPEKEGQKVGDAARMFLEQLPTTDRVWLFHWAGKAQILSHPEAVVAPNEPRFSMSPAQAREIVDGSRKARTEPLPRAEELRKMRADAIVALVPYASRAIQPISNSLREAGGTFAILIPELFAAKEDWQKVAAALTQGPNGLLTAVEDNWRRSVNFDVVEFRKLTDTTGGECYTIRKAEDLATAYAKIASQIRSSYALGYYTHAHVGAHELRVAVSRPQMKVHARSLLVVGDQKD